MKSKKKISQKLITAIAISGSLAVLLGAFGAHYLKAELSEMSLASYKTGVQYHFIHTLAALGVLALFRSDTSKTKITVLLFLIGNLLFAGSIYALTTQSITGLSVSWLGPITPIGGVLYIMGWISIIFLSFNPKA